jgi:hypothetical protein
MAYLQTAHAITRIREVIGEGRGTQYTVPPGRFQDALRRGIDEGQATLRGHEAAAPFRVEVTGAARNAASPVFNRSNLQMYDVGINVVVSRSLGATAKVDPDEAGAVTAAMLEDADILAQALGFAGNLTTTEDGDATDIVSGRLEYLSTSLATIGRDNTNQRLEATHAFSGVMVSRPGS